MKEPMMSAVIINGKAYAESLAGRIKATIPDFESRVGRVPGLAVVLVGCDPASEIYVRSKLRKTAELGLVSFAHILPEATTQKDLLGILAELNADDRVDGILVQRPLPKHLDESVVIASIDPDKDVDGLHPQSAGRLAAGIAGPVSCTPLGCLMLLKHHLGVLSGLDAIVIGRSILVGRPMAQLLLNADCTVTMAHSRTRNLADKVRQADIVVAAAGQAEMIKGDWIKPGATVIDVGTSRVIRDGKKALLGDVDFASALDIAGAITPVPGGVGPMTIITLMHNVLVVAHQRTGLPRPALW